MNFKQAFDFIKNKFLKKNKVAGDLETHSFDDDKLKSILNELSQIKNDVIQNYIRRYELDDLSAMDLYNYYLPNKVPSGLSFYDCKRAIELYNYRKEINNLRENGV